MAVDYIEARRRWRGIVRDKISRDPCDLVRRLDDVTLLNGTLQTRSGCAFVKAVYKLDARDNARIDPSGKAFAEAGFEGLFLKISRVARGYHDNALRVEQQIYEHALLPMMDHAPFTLECLGAFECNKAQFRMHSEQAQRDLLRLLRLDDEHSTSHRLRVLVLNTNEGQTLWENIDEDHRSGRLSSDTEQVETKSKYTHLLLQVFYQLLCMELQLIKHHDLHCDNILVRQLHTPITITLDINSAKAGTAAAARRVTTRRDCSVDGDRFPLIQFKTRWLASIFDFDWGSSQAHARVERNLRLDKGEVCLNRDICNNSAQYYDAFGLVMVIIHTIRGMGAGEMAWLRQFLDSIIPAASQKVLHDVYAGLEERTKTHDRLRTEGIERNARSRSQFVKCWSEQHGRDQLVAGHQQLLVREVTDLLEKLGVLVPCARSMLIQLVKSTPQPIVAVDVEADTADHLFVVPQRRLVITASPISKRGDGLFPTSCVASNELTADDASMTLQELAVTSLRRLHDIVSALNPTSFSAVSRTWEIECHQLRYGWHKQALRLYQTYCTCKGLKEAVVHADLMYVCLLLTSPQYYGCPGRFQRALLCTHSDDVDVVSRYHHSKLVRLARDIWWAFDGILPCVMPSLNGLCMDAAIE